MEKLTIFVDGMLSGTGLRDAQAGGYLRAAQLGLSDDLSKRIANWLRDYANAHFFNFEDRQEVERLDREGCEIVNSVRTELPEADVKYYSNAKMCRISC